MRFAILFSLLFIWECVFCQHYCATVEKTLQAQNIDSEYREAMRQQEIVLQQFEANEFDESIREIKEITIPVVVHVLYESDEFNIPVEQIHSQIDVLNRDFGWRQGDKDKVPAIWRDLGTDSGIRFELADIDPDGNFTTGITRKKVNESFIGGGDNYYRSAWGGTDPWPRPHYVNIWVCEIGENILGFTFLPSANAPKNDGIVMDARAFGTTGTAVEPYNGGRTLVHEMGHYFGLRHLWGMEEGSCTNTDYMSDTPWQQEPNFGCTRFPSVSCAGEANGDMFMNFMDYGDDSCAVLFTKRQVEFMRLILRTTRVGLIHSNAVTGTSQVDTDVIRIFPNPSQGQISITGLTKNTSPYELYDNTGILVAKGVVSNSNSTIDVSMLSMGIYHVHIAGVTSRLIKIHEG